GVALQQPPARGDAVGLVVEALRPQLVEVAKHLALEDPGVQRRDPVDAVATDYGAGRHAHAPAALLLDDRHAPGARVVRPEAAPHLLEESAVDLVDDLEVP